MPAIGTVFAWRVVARDADRNLRLGMVSTQHPLRIEPIALPWPDHPLVAQALAQEHGEITRWFSMDFVGARVLEEDGTTVVRLDDLRYGRYTEPLTPLWGARFVFDPEGRLVSSEWVEERYDVRPRDEVRVIITTVRGPAPPP